MVRGDRALLVGLLVGVIGASLGVTPAAAATTASWAAWTPLTGAGGAFQSSVTLAGLPALTAEVSTDSRAGQVGVIPGASVWLAEGTPVGAKYGSSTGQPYLNLRPKADSVTAPSTTTYSFQTPTPASGWTFVLGDIDADQVRIQAIGADGTALTAAELGFQGGFNYCAPDVAGKPSCTGDATDVPTWDPATFTLVGNADAADTSGAAAWFEPQTSISSLTFEFTRRAGFPIYQTWFASLARDITGAVDDSVSGPVDGVPLSLIDGNGTVVATTTTADGGLYSFPGFFATDGYTVEMTPPDGKIAVDVNRKPANLTSADAVVDFEVRDFEPVVVSGQVTDADGNPMPGVTVTIDGVSATTNSSGNYLFDTVPVGDHTATITTPDGYTLTSSPPPLSVPADDETPITGIDFVVTANPTLSGTVRVAGSGVSGVTVTAVGPGGTLAAVTAADGTYRFPLLPAGDYEVTVTPPGGSLVVGPAVRSETVAGEDVTNVDFELARPGSVQGVVTAEGGAPIPGATVTATGPDGPIELLTGDDGEYAIGALLAGDYTLTLTVPTGYTAVGPTTRSVTITAAGEAFSDQDFVVRVDALTPTPPGTLPASGIDFDPSAVWTALFAVGAGSMLLMIAAVRRREPR